MATECKNSFHKALYGDHCEHIDAYEKFFALNHRCPFCGTKEWHNYGTCWLDAEWGPNLGHCLTSWVGIGWAGMLMDSLKARVGPEMASVAAIKSITKWQADMKAAGDARRSEEEAEKAWEMEHYRLPTSVQKHVELPKKPQRVKLWWETIRECNTPPVTLSTQVLDAVLAEADLLVKSLLSGHAAPELLTEEEQWFWKRPNPNPPPSYPYHSPLPKEFTPITAADVKQPSFFERLLRSVGISAVIFMIILWFCL
jgi:hypothetical protein